MKYTAHDDFHYPLTCHIFSINELIAYINGGKTIAFPRAQGDIFKYPFSSTNCPKQFFISITILDRFLKKDFLPSIPLQSEL